MILWIVQQTIISVIFIAVIHYIYLYLKDNLTIPKTKDLVKKPIQQYKKIYNSIKENNYQQNNMKSELKNYINDLHKKNHLHVLNPSNLSEEDEQDQDQGQDQEKKEEEPTIGDINSFNNPSKAGEISNYSGSQTFYSNF